MTDHARPTLVIFQGGISTSSPLESLVGNAQAAATLDVLAAASASGAFDRTILVTEMDALSSAISNLGNLAVTVERLSAGGKSRFHFGESLLSICKKHGLERVVYVGGGAMPLATARDMADLALAVSGEGQCVTANSLYSADVVALYPTSALERIELPTADNNLAWLLHYKAGLPFAPMPRTLATQFDLDTPTDLATLWWSSQSSPLDTLVGVHLSEALQSVPQELPELAQRVELAYQVMATRRAEILVAGRVSSRVWRRLETNLPCETRIASEERGMRAGGREERGEVRSLLGLYSDLAGAAGLVKAIEQVCNAAFIDSRVLFAHRNLKPSAQDRFASDALLPEQINDPWVREFTEAVMASSIPFLLGGHSLVSGGVWAMSERVRESA